jgi:integrase
LPRIQNKALTDPQIKKLQPGPVSIDLRDGGARGLVLRVQPDGRKIFSVRYLHAGRHRRHVVGEYGKAGMTLAKARIEAGKLRSAILAGGDPAAERQAAKAVPVDTVEALAESYMRLHATRFKKSAAEDQRILNVDVLPSWKERSVKSLTRRDVRELVERKARSAPIMANAILRLVRKVLNFALDNDWIDANPASRIRKPSPETSRDRVLSEEEVRRLWRLLSHMPTTEERAAPGRKRAVGSADDPICPVNASMAALFKVLLLLGQRGGETAHMRWADLDLQNPASAWWTIPGTDTKNGETHRVPITADALAIIQAQAPEGDEEYPEYVFAGRGAGMFDRIKKAPSKLARALGIDFRGHDLRRTCATGMAEAGVTREHIAFVLNHVEGARATRVYDRFQRDREKRVALESWQRRLRAVVAEQPSPASVVPFAR